ncbi:pyruvate formate lyase activating enzyme [Lachnospiraceae bacterium XBB1006]|nr:pyruvate formate lyase activating enzyme [Lachnospiraceae bacterium XBB1006]
MQILGFAKMTLLDYPEHVAATIFTGSCNFRCPFCHNGDLVLHPQDVPIISEEEVLCVLEKRRSLLDGVCITGGEPTLQPDLADFIKKIKQFGYLVKLDTNGYRPDKLAALLEEGLLDYVAMDIKNTKEKYAMTVGVPNLQISNIEKSVQLLLSCDIPYEFRTTAMRELHTLADFQNIGDWIAGAHAYFIQPYRESEQVISPGFHAHSPEELDEIKTTLQPYVKRVELRGIDE